MKNCTRDCNDAECQKLAMNSKLCNPASELTYVCLEDADLGEGGGIYGACQPFDMINNPSASGWNVNPQCVDCCNTKDCNKNRDCTRACNVAECKANNCTGDAPYVCADGIANIQGACAPLPKVWQNDRNCTTCCDMSDCAGQVGVG